MPRTLRLELTENKKQKQFTPFEIESIEKYFTYTRYVFGYVSTSIFVWNFNENTAVLNLRLFEKNLALRKK